MSHQPFYKICGECFHWEKGRCTRFPKVEKKDETDTCGEWVCKNCWCPWDLVNYEENLDGTTETRIVDHSKCQKMDYSVEEPNGS